MTPAILVLAVFAVVVALLWSNDIRQKKKRRRLVAAAVDDLFIDCQVDPANPSVRGTLHGLEVCFRLTRREKEGNSANWTECDVTLSSDWFLLDVKPQGRGAEETVARVKFTDLEFNAKFVVEAAPAALARRVLNKKMRARLRELHPVAIETIANGLCLSKEGWLEDPDAIRSFAELASTLGRRIDDAGEALQEAEHRAGRENAALVGYRGAAREQALETASDEVAALRASREERVKQRKRRDAATAAILVFFGVIIAIVADYAGC